MFGSYTMGKNEEVGNEHRKKRERGVVSTVKGRRIRRHERKTCLKKRTGDGTCWDEGGAVRETNQWISFRGSSL